MKAPKKTVWLFDSLEKLRSFPGEVKDSVGYSLHQIEQGKMPKSAKPLTGFKPAVIEIIADFDKNAYRVVFTVKIGERIYILHCFQKKSNKGIKTPKQELDLIWQRLKEAEMLDKLLGDDHGYTQN